MADPMSPNHMARTHASGRRVAIHGHRGARGLFPDNTLEGFAYALSAGAAMLELDVQMSQDGVLIASHDLCLNSDSTRDDRGQWLAEQGPEVISLTYEQLRCYNVGGFRPGSQEAARFPEQAFLRSSAIPRLDEVMDLCNTAGAGRAGLNIEIKSDPNLPSHCARRVDFVDALIALINRHAFAAPLLLQSFDWAVLDLLAEKAPKLPRSYLSLERRERADGPLPDWGTIFKGSCWLGKADYDGHKGIVPDMVAAAGGVGWSCFYKDLTPDLLARAHGLGLEVLVWTVNERADINRMIGMGVDAIITDYPARVQQALLHHELSWVGLGLGLMIYSAHVTMDEAFARYEAVRGRFPSAVARQAGPPCGRPIADLSLITGAFDIFVFDAFGVLNVGERPIDGARARIDALRAAGKHLFVLTNAASYNRDEAREKFRRLGFDFTDEEIISSRAVCEQHLKAFQADLTWGIIAQDGFDPSDLGVRSVLLGDDAALYDRADAFLFLSSAAWGDERQALLRSSLSRAARPIVVANPDLVAPARGGAVRWNRAGMSMTLSTPCQGLRSISTASLLQAFMRRLRADLDVRPIHRVS